MCVGVGACVRACVCVFKELPEEFKSADWSLDTSIMVSILMVEILLDLMPFSTTLMADNGSFMSARPDCMIDLIALIASHYPYDHLTDQADTI